MARKENFNKIKFQQNIANEINFLLRREFSDPRLQFVSITHVSLNNDYSIASVYWDTFDPSKRGDVKKAIEGISSNMRKKLADNLKFRSTPELNFIYNSQFEDEKKIEELLNKSE